MPRTHKSNPRIRTQYEREYDQIEKQSLLVHLDQPNLMLQREHIVMEKRLQQERLAMDQRLQQERLAMDRR